MREVKDTPEFTMTPVVEDEWWVLSKESGETYRVNISDFVCSCPSWRFQHAKGDKSCKHIKAICDAYQIEPKAMTPVAQEGTTGAITISQEEIIKELSSQLREHMIRNYVYAVPDYEREYTDKLGRGKKAKKAGWIDLRAAGVRDLAHMVADRYGSIEVGDFRFMDVGDRWVAWRDIKLGNFTATGFADSSKDREFPFRYLGEVVMRNAYRAIVPKIYQDIFTGKFRELMRAELRELLGTDGEAKLGKPIESLTDGELAKHLKESQPGKRPLGADTRTDNPPDEEEEAGWNGFWAQAEEIGLSQKRVLEMLGVNSIKEWKAAGRTLGEAIEVVSSKLTQSESDETIDRDWLNQSQKTLKWPDETMLSFLACQYRVSGKTVAEALSKLSRDQARVFVKQINRKLENLIWC